MPTLTETQDQEQSESVILISASRKCRKFHQEFFPTQIERWLKECFPEVQLEPVTVSELGSFDFKVHEPLFRLKLSESQLTAFLTLWHARIAGQFDGDTGIDVYELTEFGLAIIPPVLIDINGKLLRSIEEIDQTEQPKYMFLIIPNPKWQYYHPYRFPAPLRYWFDRYLPHVRIEQTSGFQNPHKLLSDNGGPEHTAELTHPMFWADLSLDEHAFLQTNWPKTMFTAPDDPCDFFVIEVYGLPGRSVLEGFPDMTATELRGSTLDGE